MNSRFFIIFLYFAEVSLDQLTPQVMLGLKIECSGIKKESPYVCIIDIDGKNYTEMSNFGSRLLLINDKAYNQDYTGSEIAATLYGKLEGTYKQPKVTQFFYNVKYDPYDHIRLIYTCQKNNALYQTVKTPVDHILMIPYAVFTTIKCYPCHGLMSDTQFRGKIKIFPTLATTTFRAVSVLFHKIYIMLDNDHNNLGGPFYYPFDNHKNELKTEVIMFNLIKKSYYGPTHYNEFRFSGFNKTALITLSHEEVTSTKNLYLVGVTPSKFISTPGRVHYLDSFNFYKYVLLPYEYVLLDKYGLAKGFRGVGMTYYLSYGYSGLNSQFRCTNSLKSSRLKKCTDSSIIKCANKYRSGFECDKEMSICNTNPCKFNGICVNGTATNYECKCSPNTFGKSCEMFTCQSGCQNSVCIGPNTCGPCENGFTGPECKTVSCDRYFRCRHGNCTIKNNKRKCVCDSTVATGDFCQFQCRPSCVKGQCTIHDSEALCVCDEGYEGMDCSVKAYESAIRVIPSSKNFIIAISLYVIIVFIALCIIFSIQINLIGLKNNSYEIKTLQSMH